MQKPEQLSNPIAINPIHSLSQVFNNKRTFNAEQLKTVLLALREANPDWQGFEHEAQLEAFKEAIEQTYMLDTQLLPGGCVQDGFSLPPSVSYNSTDLLGAASRNDVALIETILKQPNIDINIQGTFGETPLHVAAILNHTDTAMMLIEHGADVTIKAYAEPSYDDIGVSALEMAFYTGNLELAELMIAHPTILQMDLDELLLIAAEYNHCELLELALSQGAADEVPDYLIEIIAWEKVFSFSELIHEVDANTDYANIEQTAQMLIRLAELSGTALTNNPLPGLSVEPMAAWVEISADWETDPKLNQIIRDTADSLKTIDDNYQIYVETKQLFHIIPMEGEFNIRYEASSGSGRSTIEAEGFHHCYTVPLAADGIYQYLDKVTTPEAYHAFELAYQSFDRTAQYATQYGLQATADALYDAFMNNQTIVLSSGWTGHAADIVLDKSQGLLVMSNNGWRYEGLESGSTVFKMHNPDNVTPELIHTILINENQVNFELLLTARLGLVEYQILPENDQIVGNCAWVAHESAIEGLLFIDFLKQGFDLKQATELAHEHYDLWSSAFAVSFINHYFEGDVRIDAKAIEALIKTHAKVLDVTSIGELRQDDVGEALVQAYESNTHRSAYSIVLNSGLDALTLSDLIHPRFEALHLDDAPNHDGNQTTSELHVSTGLLPELPTIELSVDII